MKLLYIEWADAISNARWMTKDVAEDWAKTSDWIIRMCGWLIEENKEHIVVALGWKPEDEFTEEQFVNIHKIPKTWIIKRKIIKV